MRISNTKSDVLHFKKTATDRQFQQINVQSFCQFDGCEMSVKSYFGTIEHEIQLLGYFNFHTLIYTRAYSKLFLIILFIHGPVYVMI